MKVLVHVEEPLPVQISYAVLLHLQIGLKADPASDGKGPSGLDKDVGFEAFPQVPAFFDVVSINEGDDCKDLFIL